MLKDFIRKTALYLGIFLMVGIMLFPDLKETIINIVDTFLAPLSSILPLHIIIFILAAITGLYASLIQKYTMDWELMRRVQDRMKNMQKEFRQAQLANNPQKMKKLEAQRAEMMGDQMEMMKQQFKPMLYISIISLPLFFWVFTIVTPVHFTWDDIPLNDSSKLITFLEKTQDAKWEKDAKIEKSIDGRMITVADGVNSYTINLDIEKKIATLKNDTSNPQEYLVKMENEKINIYAPSATMVFPFWGKQKIDDVLWGPFQYWLFWYFLCSIPVSQMTRKALNIGGM